MLYNFICVFVHFVARLVLVQLFELESFCDVINYSLSLNGKLVHCTVVRVRCARLFLDLAVVNACLVTIELVLM